jgi:hypothetical protein
MKSYTAVYGMSTKQQAETNVMSNSFADQLKKVSHALMAAQIAIYPVDASAIGKDSHSSSQDSMRSIAADTGGKAYIHRNDLAESLHEGIDDGSTYYTLEYYPENKNWDGRFRKIDVKTTKPGVTLRHREGYFALDPEKSRKREQEEIAEDFSRAMKLETPSMTGVVFQAAVVGPSQQTGNKRVVSFGVDPHTITFEHGDDGMEHARVVCAAWAYSKNKDKPILPKEKTTTADLKPEVFRQVMASYFPCRQELELPSGTYALKLGVLDRTSNHIGTLTTTVNVP